ncbi:ParB/Srx family N-terminal domain-containing protein (plasmid) [Sphingobium sp. YC-XJ3]|nr:ParB/Srx family N-terminal domain-containing protein [Sphingobium sp. YC-XJ3]WDA39293.1 ParB/Srx family N-terminal domain-containing protein [Sphingobium sp. YC-XJ3]
MTKQLPKLVLSPSRDIPFSQLVLSQKNVRRLKAGLSIEDLAEDIYRRTLLQSLNVRPVVGEDGQETGMFEVPAGGRRFRALELLVKSKRMAKDQPVPCVVREAGIAEEDSLAENVMRVGLLGHVSEVSFDERSETLPCLFQAARSAYPKSWRRAAWNKHLRQSRGQIRRQHGCHAGAV